METLFPAVPSEIPAQAAQTVGRSPVYDSAAGRFLVRDGALAECSGAQAVRQWIELALKQQIDWVPIYRTNGEARIGIDRQLMGSKLPSGLAAAELERNVRETLSFCPAIRAVRDMNVRRSGRACEISLTAVLYDGQSVEVSTHV